MKKFLMMAVLAAAGFAQAGNDSWLYWMVTDDSKVGDWEYAKLYVKDGSGKNVAYLTLSDGYNSGIDVSCGSDVTTADKNYATDSIAAALGSYYGDAYSYVVELFDSADARLAYSTALSYDKAKSHIGSTMSPASGGEWAASGWTTVPEPTSGLLALLGMAALALRRRRMA